MNTCQAVVTPECNKGNVAKSKGVWTASVSLLTELTTDESNQISSKGHCQQKESSLILLEKKKVISQKTATVLVEFEGVKFKAFGRSELQYLRYVENGALSPCTCDTPEQHNEIPCKQFAIQVRSHFSSGKGYICSAKLDIKQKKGEAELVQADWLCYIATGIKEGESVVSYASSMDIDSIPLHILVVSLYLPRTDYGNFKNHVYAIIKTPGSAGKLDI
ncbi:hypothetical protein CHS0354_028180 [Potamilus streckersoni]|uniref:Uncharacterized protein n=1 Tax=Potamilus streckersoni TaxID=2493646 RepID=A0AAE0TI28_9BIVA|nr:hypothetical protein CHS0354_028180 [Potamilus streckersoni]